MTSAALMSNHDVSPVSIVTSGTITLLHNSIKSIATIAAVTMSGTATTATRN